VTYIFKEGDGFCSSPGAQNEPAQLIIIFQSRIIPARVGYAIIQTIKKLSEPGAMNGTPEDQTI
jgi:hypothetical protein